MRPRFTTTAIPLVTALVLALAPACGDDGGGGNADATINGPDAKDLTPDGAVNDAPLGIDAAPPADAMFCATDLSPTDDGTAQPADLVISEINPGLRIELYNATNSPISLSSVTHQFCSPFKYRALSALAPQVTVPPKGFALVPWPSNFDDTDSGGEVILYKDNSFGNNDSILDFVCWGTNPHGTRIGQAVCAGKWGGDCSNPTMPTADACAPALTNGAIHRKMSTTGTSAADYDTDSAASPANCVQP